MGYCKVTMMCTRGRRKSALDKLKEIKPLLSEKVTNNKKVMAICVERIVSLNDYAMRRIRGHSSRSSEEFSCVVLDEIIIDDRRRGTAYPKALTKAVSCELKEGQRVEATKRYTSAKNFLKPRAIKKGTLTGKKGSGKWEVAFDGGTNQYVPKDKITVTGVDLQELHKWLLGFRKEIMEKHKTLEDRIRVIEDPKSFDQERFKIPGNPKESKMPSTASS